MVLSVGFFMHHPPVGEPEPEAGQADPVWRFDAIKVYAFLCRCVAQADDLMSLLENELPIADVAATRDALLVKFSDFESNGISRNGIDEMLFLHEALQRHDDGFSAFDFQAELTNVATEPEPEDILSEDVPADFDCSQMGEPFQPMSPEHMCVWTIERLTNRISRAMMDGRFGNMRKLVAMRQIMVNVIKICREDPGQHRRAWYMMNTITDVSSSDSEDDP